MTTLRRILSDGIKPLDRDFVALLVECSTLAQGREIHRVCREVRMELDPYVATALVHMYGKLGSVSEARSLFQRLTDVGHIASWNAMLTAFARNGHHLQALGLFFNMQLQGAKPNSITFIVLVDVCAKLRLLKATLLVGSCLRELEEAQGVLITSLPIANALINAYSSCGSLEKASQVFAAREDHQRDIVTWTSMIAGFARQGLWTKALFLFRMMQLQGLRLDRVIFVTITAACHSLAEGRLIHSCAGELNREVQVANALITMYDRCNSVEEALATFNSIQNKDVVSWNSMIAAYRHHSKHSEALKLLCEMQLRGVKPDCFTFISVLPACAASQALREGRMIHSWVLESGLESDAMLGNAIIDMYGSCRSTEDACRVFEKLHSRDQVAWNALMTAFAQPGESCQQSLHLFHQMQLNGVMPDEVSLVAALSACALEALLDEGMKLHNRVAACGLLNTGSIANALLNMYAKSGSLMRAKELFDNMTPPNEMSWNGMISAFAQHGHADEVLDCFRRMHQDGHLPNDVTFVSVLSACSHGGHVSQAVELFATLIHDYGGSICLRPSHYHCLLDVIARAGKLREADGLITRLPDYMKADDQVVLCTMLGASKTHKDLERAKKSAEDLMVLTPDRCSSYVVLSGLYDQAGRKEEAGRIRRLMHQRNIRKQPAFSSITIRNRTQEFYSGDLSHLQIQQILTELERLYSEMSKLGYSPEIQDSPLHDVEETEKKRLLSHHSEKLAICFGLINTAPGSALRIIKHNLRVCIDCHTVTKLISRITNRLIIVRDSHRFHHFERGSCSCGDYW